MKHKVLVRRVSLLIFNDEDTDNYSACCQININGTHGTIDSLLGTDFYLFLKTHGFDVFKNLGLKEVACNVSTAHLTLIKRYLKHTNIDIHEVDKHKHTDDFILNWITFKEKVA
jgi:hypothetical protein